MNVVAAVFADFEQTFLGQPSRLEASLAGEPVLRHTLKRLARVRGVERICVVVTEAQLATGQALAAGLSASIPIEVLPLDHGQRPRRGLFRCARKWNLAAWRSGLLGATWFDEYVEPLVVGRVLDHYQAAAALCIEGHQAVVDPALCSAMLEHLAAHRDETDWVFTQAPPGLAGLVLGRQTTRKLLEDTLPVGWRLSYHPELARLDPITKPPCCRVEPEIVARPVRWLADTASGLARLERALQRLGPQADAAALSRWAAQDALDRPDPLPAEVELELTTDYPLPGTTLRPRRHVPRRRLEDFDALQRLAAELGRADLRTVVLAGHGDPLAHPRFGEACRLLREAGVLGLAVESPLVELSDRQIDALVAAQVDVVEVRLDAASRETYRRVHGADKYEQVLANLERLEAARQQRSSPPPLVVCSLTRCAATFDELEEFYDGWIRRRMTAVLRGYNDYCGRLPADTLLATTPLVREPCRRLARCAVLLADGRAVLCSQDVRGEMVIGDWFAQPLAEIWRSDELAAARAAQQGLTFDNFPLCAACDQWHRP